MLKHIKSLLEHNAYLIAIFITIAIAYLSLSNPIQIELPIRITFLDKILHASAYFVLTTSWLFALRNYPNKKWIGIALFLYGILMEFLQGWLTNNREKDIFDVVANTIGIIFATLIFRKIYKYFVKIFDK